MLTRVEDFQNLTGPEKYPTAEQVRAALSSILASPEFHASRRCSDFLRFVVEETLAGRADELKERIIGAAVFGRLPDYDTGGDSSVRVRANEVRKRLVQYYLGTGALDPVRILLAAGTYVPMFSFHESAVPEALPAELPLTKPVSAKPGWRLIACALCACLVLAAAVVWRHMAQSPLERFWKPLDGVHSVLLCMDYKTLYRTPHGLPDGGARSELIEVRQEYVGAGAVYAMRDLSACLSRKHIAIDLRIGADASAADLRQSPAILMGAINNRWSEIMTRDFRIAVATDSNSPVFRETVAPHRLWRVDPVAPDGTAGEDFALVSRVFHPDTGQFMVALAGLTQWGTRSAAEFVTHEDLIATALSRLPSGWEKHSLQILLHCRIIRGTPSPAQVIAVETW